MRGGGHPRRWAVDELLAFHGSAGPAWMLEHLRGSARQRRRTWDDLVRGTSRRGPNRGRPYAPSTIVALRSTLRGLDRCLAEVEAALRRLDPAGTAREASAIRREAVGLAPVVLS